MSEFDLAQEYAKYLQRFDATVGLREVGEFVKHDGRLVKRLSFDEFTPVFREYFETTHLYVTSVDRGDTINDVMVKTLRERARELFLKSPV